MKKEKSLTNLFEVFEKNVIRTDSIFAGTNSSGGSNAQCDSGQYEVDTAGDPNTFVNCETQCNIDPDECDRLIASVMKAKAMPK